MKAFLLLLIAFYTQGEALPSIFQLQGEAWEEAVKRLSELEEYVFEEYDEGNKLIQNIEHYFNKDVERLLNSSSNSINETTELYLKGIDEWIEKAKKQNIDPSNCTIDRETIEFDLPNITTQNILNSWMENEAWRELNTALRNFTIVPNRVHDLESKLHKCGEKNEECINLVLKEINEAFENIPFDIVMYEQKIENLMENVLIDALETDIRENLLKLKEKDDELAEKDIQCIKNLIKK